MYTLMKANIAHAYRRHQDFGATTNKLSAEQRTNLTNFD